MNVWKCIATILPFFPENERTKLVMFIVVVFALAVCGVVIASFVILGANAAYVWGSLLGVGAIGYRFKATGA